MNDMGGYEPNPEDQFAATTLDRPVFDGEPTAVAPTAAPKGDVQAAQGRPLSASAAVPPPRGAEPPESDLMLKVALGVVIAVAALLMLFLVSLAFAS